MKKMCIVLLLYIFTSFSFAQTTAIPDINFENFLITQGIDTNGANGNILNTDAETVTSLNINVDNIANFTGLEAFVNLEELTISNNHTIQTFSVSANTKLKTLDIRSGYILNPGFVWSPLTTLDLSNNTLLEEITIRDFRNMTTLTLPETNTLKKIYIYYLKVSEINLSKLNGLEDIYISNTAASLTNITLPDETQVLKKIFIGHISIPDINLSPYTVLEDIELRITYVENLQLPTTNTLKKLIITWHKIVTPLSLASVPELIDLEISSNQTNVPLQLDITNNVKLVNVNLYSNKMTGIDVTNNTLIEDLNISNNQLPSVNLTNNTLLETLNASNNVIPNLDITQNTVLETVNLSNNLLPNLDVTNNITLGSLNISNNKFTGTGLDLTRNVELYYLNVSHNQIESLNISNCVKLSSFNGSYNLFSGTAILDQLYVIRLNHSGINASNLIDVSFNNLSGTIPDFASLVDTNTNYFKFLFNDNAFHFGDFENQHSDFITYMSSTNTFGGSELPIMTKYYYAPQAKVNAIENLTPNAGETITLTTTVRGAQNHYKWFKDGVEITGAPDSPNYIITDINDCDSATYHCEITSDLVPFENANPPGTGGKNLLLVRNDINVTVTVNKTCTTLSDPLNGAVNVPINTGLTWNANRGACGYRLNVGTSSGGTDIVNNEDVNNVTTYNFTSDLPANTEIFVTITPYFSDGNLAGCTEESFTTGTTQVAPTCTNITTPTNGATDISISTNIIWDTVANADDYLLTIGTSSGANDITNTTVTGTTYDIPTDLAENNTYYVTVIPQNSTGQATGCTEISFTTETMTTAPTCTNVTTPTNGATNVSISTNIIWDAVANADDYLLTIGTSSGGNDITNTTVTGTTYDIPTNLAENTTYYVTVIPQNSTGQATGCTEISFTTETMATAPTCTNITTPTNGATDISINTNIVWDAVANADDYLLTIGTSSGGNDITSTTVTGTTYDIPTNLAENTTYYVTVIPQNAIGQATGCTEISFTTETMTTAPTCTNVTTPTNGATGISISTNIVWNAVANADDYLLTIGTSSGGNDITSTTVTGTTYDIPTDLTENTIYYVSVIPQNAIGQATGCNEISFTTKEPVFVDETKYGFSPDGDGINETWKIVGIEQYPNNSVSIFNRWGDLVFQVNNYDNTNNVFKGKANRLKSLGADELPEGTYFFTITIQGTHNLKKTKGFLVLKR